MASTLGKILRYLHPDRTILNERPAFDDELSAPLFRKGNEVGCLTVHGIGGTPANVRVVADALAAEGYTVLSPALPGHRETVGALNASTEAEWRRSVLDAYDRLKAEGCARVYALGLSLGGVLSAFLAEEREISGAALICAPLKMTKFLRIARRIRAFVPFIRYPEDEKTQRPWRADSYAQMYDGFSVLKLQDLYLLQKRVNSRLAAISCPILAFTAKWDDKVDPVSMEILRSGAVNAPSIEHVFLEESPHGCTYGPEKEDVAARCAAFVRGLEAKRS